MAFSEEDLEEFRAEALELLDVAEKGLLALDKGAEFAAPYDAVFRGFHNLKGASGMMELHDLQAHTHELESILVTFKSAGSIPKERISFFLRGIDAARSLLRGEKVDFRFGADVAPTSPEAVPAAAPKAEPAPESGRSFGGGVLDGSLGEFVNECEEIVERVSVGLQQLEGGGFDKDLVDALYRDVHTLKGTAYLFGFPDLGEFAHAMEAILDDLRSGTEQLSKSSLDGLFLGLKSTEACVNRIKSGAPAAIAAVPEVAPAPTPAPVQAAAPVAAPAAREGEAEAASSIRVPVPLLDSLMTLMGEMVLVRNQVLQYSNASEDLEFVSMSKRLSVVTSEMQGEMMKTRMQPIGNVLAKFNRVVRDLAQELGKSISFQVSGAETELDKSLLEAIKDPLTHIVRNSCDHGVEGIEDRRKAGKPETGTITVKAYHEGGQVIVEISDDGRGLRKELLLKKAIEKGVVTEAQAARMSDKDVYALIFAPGFSTAAKVTNVSGRGVGMDVVRTNVERIGGAIDLSTIEGAGTTFKIKIPLTLAIVPALIVRSGGGTFAIPQMKLEELVRVDQSNASDCIELLHGAPVYRLRGDILPLVDMGRLLAGRETEDVLGEGGVVNVAVLNADGRRFGAIIDEVQDTADIVVKPLNRLLRSLQIYSGATILGDGSVALIFDVAGIARHARVGVDEQRMQEAAKAAADRARSSAENQEFLLVRLASDAKHALPLIYVHRLEEFKASDVERSGENRVVRYGDVLLPLVSANKELGYETQRADPERVPAVVIERGGSFYGIEVDEILDVLSTDRQVDSGLPQRGCVFGHLNMPDGLVVVADPFGLIASAFPSAPMVPSVSMALGAAQAAGAEPTRALKAASGRRRVLLAEDNVFFRRAMKAILDSEGYETIIANNGQEAIDLLDRDPTGFDVIVSDIEMPRKNGFELARVVRGRADTRMTPLVAVSARADKKHVSEGEAAGFDIYLEKLKAEDLLAAVAGLIGRHKENAA